MTKGKNIVMHNSYHDSLHNNGIQSHEHISENMNLTEDSKQYTSCCASPGSPVLQYKKICQGLKTCPAYFTALMNDILSELLPDIREYIECIMDDCIIFTPDS